MATITVNAGGSLRSAITTANPGDVIKLAAGATFQTGQIDVPIKPAGADITITSTAPLPARRLTAADTNLLPTIVSGIGVSPLQFLAGVRGWTLDGLRFLPNAQGQNTVLLVEGADRITFDRLLFEGDPTFGQRRFILGNGTAIKLTRSHIVGCFDVNNGDSQTFCAYNGAGPFTIANNTLEAASENIMFGGADSSSPANVPANILVEDNYCYKRLAWKGTPRGVKNLFELKQAKGAIIRRNTFENNWTDAQSGASILFTVRNDDGGAPWAVVEDVLFEHNTLINGETGFNILGHDQYRGPGSGRCQRIMIRHNTIKTGGKSFQIGGEVKDLTIDSNVFEIQWLSDNIWGLLYHGAIWPTSEHLTGPRRTRFAVENFTLTNNVTPGKPFGETTGNGYDWQALTSPTNPNTDGNWHPNGHAVGTVNFNGTIVENPVPPLVTVPVPPPVVVPPPVDPCAANPLLVTHITWPGGYGVGSRALGFRTNKAWKSATITKPGTLTVTAENGCVTTVKKPGT